jgi:uncharacterized protein YlxW (UPF0749 family)
LPDLDTAYMEAFHAAQAMWSELLAERSDPLLRSFEIADASGRVLLVLPFQEVLERAHKTKDVLPNEVKSTHALLEKTRTLAASLRDEIETAQKTIDTAQESMRQTQEVLDRLLPLRAGE